jgi:hypothetical protein
MREELLEYIYTRNLRQKKKISKFLEEANTYDELDKFLKTYSIYMQKMIFRFLRLATHIFKL